MRRADMSPWERDLTVPGTVLKVLERIEAMPRITIWVEILDAVPLLSG